MSALLALSIALLLPGAAAATTITPTTLLDDNTVNGNCTLREAVRAANGDAAIDACPAGTGQDTIQLQPGIYSLSVGGTGEAAAATGDLDITDPDDVTIIGAAGGTTINAFGIDRVFEVFEGGVVATFDGLTIRGGGAVSFGGGISTVNGGTTNLLRSTVTDNAANVGGGGLDMAGTAAFNVIDSTISGNRAVGASGHGGGINIDGGPMTLTNSTVSGNTATDQAGGIQVSSSTLNATASTITDNSTGTGGGIVAGGMEPSVVTLKGTILAGNRATVAGPDCAGDPIGSGGHNLLGSSSGCTFTNQPTDLVGQNPQLSPLAANGGPTQTHALAATSPAVDKGDAPATDQRGAPRTLPDIGAYEYVECLGVVVNVVGTPGADSFEGFPGRTYGVLALAGDDEIRTSQGNDAVCAGAGDDDVFLSRGNDKADGGPGDDGVDGAAGNDVLAGAEGNDRLGGVEGRNRLIGGPGNDLVFGGNGIDKVSGGTGRDKVLTHAGKDRVSGGAGPDRVFGSEGIDALFGNGGADRLFGGPANDRLMGGGGNDRLDGGPGKRDRCAGAGGSRDKAKPSCEKTPGVP